MTKKEKFIEFVKNLMGSISMSEVDPDVLDYWNGLQVTGDTSKPRFTENGKLVLSFMRDNKNNYNNLFKARDIGEGLGISSRTASGAMRKLVGDGFVEKIGESPICYSLTTEGIEVSLDDTEA